MKKLLYFLVITSCMNATMHLHAESERVLSIDREVIIANNTNKKLDWHMITIAGVDDRNGPINPGEIHTLYTGGSLKRFEFTFKETGQTPETRGYAIDLEYSADRDWMFTVDGEPFVGNWSVCGMRKKSDAASLAESIAEFGGAAISIAVIAVLTASSIAATGGLSTAPSGAAGAAAIAAVATQVVSASTVIVMQSVKLAATGGLETISNWDKLGEIAQEMHFDKCEWVYNGVKVKNGTKDYLMKVEEGNVGTYISAGDSVWINRDRKVKLTAYKRYAEMKDRKIRHKKIKIDTKNDGSIELWEENKVSAADDVSFSTTFYNYTTKPAEIIREQTHVVGVLRPQYTDSERNLIHPSIKNKHDGGDDFRFYLYDANKPIVSEQAGLSKHTTVTVSGDELVLTAK